MPDTAQNVHAQPPSPGNISILLVSQHHEDHSSLRHILHHDGWLINRCASVREVSSVLEDNAPSIIICERDLPDGNWKDVLSQVENRPNAPLVLVTSRYADESLWGEVLNLGGYDVLLKPFDCSEVTRVLGMAWRQWFRPLTPHLVPRFA